MFNENSGLKAPSFLIPDKTIAMVYLSINELKFGKTTGAPYWDMTLEVRNGPYHGRKIFNVMLMCPFGENIDQKTKDFSIVHLTRMLETTGVFVPGQPDTYAKFDKDTKPGEVDILLTGRQYGVVLGVSINKDPNYSDKNNVKEWLTPNPACKSTFSKWTALKDGTAYKEQMAKFEAEKISPTGLNSSIPVASYATAPSWMGAPASSNFVPLESQPY